MLEQHVIRPVRVIDVLVNVYDARVTCGGSGTARKDGPGKPDARNGKKFTAGEILFQSCMIRRDVAHG